MTASPQTPPASRRQLVARRPERSFLRTGSGVKASRRIMVFARGRMLRENDLVANSFLSRYDQPDYIQAYAKFAAHATMSRHEFRCGKPPTGCPVRRLNSRGGFR